MKIPYFNFAAIAVLIVIIVSIILKKTYRSRANVFFLICTIVIAITTVFDIFAVRLDLMGPGNVAAKWFFHGGYIYFHTTSALFYLFYLIALTDTYFRFSKSIGKLILVFAPIIIYTIIFFAGYFDGFPVYYIDASDTYNRGPAMMVGYAVGAIYLLYGIYYIIHYRKLFNTKWIISLFAFYPFIVIAMAVEFFNPNMIIEMFANAIAMLCVLTYLQRPEEENEPYSEIGNSVSLDAHLRRNFINGQNFVDIIVSVKNYTSIIKLLNYNDQIRLKQGIGTYFRQINSEFKLNSGLYNGTVGYYHVLVNADKYDRILASADRMLKDFNSPIRIGAVEVSPVASVMIVNAPKDFDDFETFRRFVNTDYDISTSEIVFATDMLRRDYYRIYMDIDRIIDEAIAHKRFELYYQPIYNLKEGRFTAAEALLRLKDPKYGMVSPALFIPAAERSGAIHKIWKYIINSACQFVTSDSFKYLKLDFIDINLSAVQCVHEGMAEEIIAVLDKHGVPHNAINIEITETAFAYDEDALRENITKLDAAGIGISLDDYGTGYSDTGRIMSLPLRIVKLDRSFVLFAEDKKLSSIVRHTIEMLNDIDVDIVAEGIENKELVDEIESMGCNLVQGWYYSRALSERGFVKFLEENNAN